jgi:hypothetical protein
MCRHGQKYLQNNNVPSIRLFDFVRDNEILCIECIRNEMPSSITGANILQLLRNILRIFAIIRISAVIEVALHLRNRRYS